MLIGASGSDMLDLAGQAGSTLFDLVMSQFRFFYALSNLKSDPGQ